MAKNTDFQRAPDAPSLPTGTIRFILHCLARFKGWIILMLLMETGQAAGGILVPYAIKEIMDAVVQGEGTPLLENLREPLLLLAGLNLAEILFSRASGAILIIMGPRLRQYTTKALYAYLQYHAPRYFSSHFAGALAHRISETAMSAYSYDHEHPFLSS